MSDWCLSLSSHTEGFGHWRTGSQAAETQDETVNFKPSVRTIEAKADAKPIELTLPGQTAPFDQAAIIPRATGYIAERTADIGTRLKKGERIVRIASPDLDRQLDQAIAQLGQVQAALMQAQAQVDQAEANLKNSNTTFSRTTALLQRGFETVQNRDNQQTTVLSQQATLETSARWRQSCRRKHSSAGSHSRTPAHPYRIRKRGCPV